MRTEKVLDLFGGNSAATKALGLKSTGTISNWGPIVPRGMAFELQHITGGLLSVDLSCYKPELRDNPEKLAEIEHICRVKRKEKKPG
jgi:hypothetical protein